MIRKQIAAANWKMNLSLSQAETLADELMKSENKLDIHQQVILAVPFPYLTAIHQKVNHHNHFHVSAQNCAATRNGAFTGEVSAEMLRDIDIQYVIIGHSERRAYYHETNDILVKKINLALEFGLKPIFCCGEPLPVRESNEQNTHVANQLKEDLFHLTGEQMKHFIIAYEPIWAIGTGKTASSDQAQEMHQYIRKVISNQYGHSVADTVSILYGGSVKANNAEEIFSKPDVDGGLVGGASLVASEFSTIINSLKSIIL
ncbi:MAG: triose-phosphate isomerase [Bacteroidota bacterium]